MNRRRGFRPQRVAALLVRAIAARPARRGCLLAAGLCVAAGGCQQFGVPRGATPSAADPSAAAPPPEAERRAAATQPSAPEVVPASATALPCPDCGPAGAGHAHAAPAAGHGAGAWGAPLPAPYRPNPQEYLCDGGDALPPARVRRDESVVGLDLEDTVVAYETRQGETYVEPSNRVCVYAPRFAAVRKVVGAIESEKAETVGGVDRPEGAVPAESRLPSLQFADIDGPLPSNNIHALDGFRESMGGRILDGEQQPEQAAEVRTPMAQLATLEQAVLDEGLGPRLARAALAAETWTIGAGVEVVIDGTRAAEHTEAQAADGVHTYELRGKGRMRICKVADRNAARVGDTVTFVLRVDNIGDGPVHDVVVLDNLTTRLEYVEDSQSATKGAEFSTDVNEGESLKLRWEFTDAFEVGESAIIRFQARVR